MDSRLLLQSELEAILGSRNVYFQPPSSIKMAYPAIVYSRDTMENRFANDKVYTTEKAYEVILIDKNPDSTIVNKLAVMPTCRFVRNFTADSLNHDVFIIHF